MKTPIWVTILVISCLLSFKLGIDFGVYQFVICDSPYKAYMHYSLLKNIENQQFKSVKSYHEYHLTTEIERTGRFLSHGMPYLLVPINDLNSADMYIADPEVFIKEVAKYRKNNPIEWPWDLSNCTSDKINSICKDLIAQKEYYDKAINHITSH